jgi:Ca-activated chloride channel family protein
MEGARLDSLKDAMGGLAGLDTSLTGSFAQFRNREDVTIIPFSSTVHGVEQFTVSGTDPNSPDRLAIRFAVESLVGHGNTAIYSALARAYQEGLASLVLEPDRLTSIVLLTDGENNSGMSATAFLTFLTALPTEARHIRTFPVLFGEADPAALHQVADLTGGKVFDSRSVSLSEVFKEIRGYQ